jgi:hypothetical protein
VDVTSELGNITTTVHGNTYRQLLRALPGREYAGLIAGRWSDLNGVQNIGQTQYLLFTPSASFGLGTNLTDNMTGVNSARPPRPPRGSHPPVASLGSNHPERDAHSTCFLKAAPARRSIRTRLTVTS